MEMEPGHFAQEEMIRVQKIIQEYQAQKWGLIPLLQKVQGELGYIPKETLKPIAEALNLFPSQVQGV
ncbi:MAG: NAD(P)H-dependent oxidoreductase subunit E, partial [Deltaproteobacteria bacterium]|nr:NAD(P)H-dependent oxidoreductase subunit E [Deltaproteobacteria bacterium]